MKRTLLLASFVGLLGFTLYAQNGSSAGKTVNGGQNTGDVNNSALPRSRGPNAQVTVSPGPQGLPVVNSSASAWPLGPVLEEHLNFRLNGVPQAGENGGDQASQPAVQNSRPRTSDQSKPSFEPPPMGALPSLGAPGPGGRAPVSMGPDVVTPDSQVQRDRQNSPAGEVPQAGTQNGAPAQNGETSGQQPVSQPQPRHDQLGVRLSQSPRQGRQNSQTPGSQPSQARQNPAPPPGDGSSSGKRVIVVPSPVHYDRAGRRVVEPGWQETMYRMIQAEKQAASPAAGPGEGGEPAGTGQAAEGKGEGNLGARDEPAARETIIVVPGPAVWRIRGTLTAARGMLALEDGEGVLWYLPGLDRYIGFIDGLEAGEEAALEGYAPPRGSSQERYFQPIRLFIDEMAYDLTIPPYGIAIPAQGSGGQTTVIREIERRGPGKKAGGDGGPAQGKRPGRDGPYDDDGDDDWYQDAPDTRGDPVPRGRERRERSRRGNPPAPPAWEHHHKSPWAPPPSVLEFEMDYDSIWREDEAKRRQRERDSREIWY